MVDPKGPRHHTPPRPSELGLCDPDLVSVLLRPGLATRIPGGMERWERGEAREMSLTTLVTRESRP